MPLFLDPDPRIRWPSGSGLIRINKTQRLERKLNELSFLALWLLFWLRLYYTAVMLLHTKNYYYYDLIFRYVKRIIFEIFKKPFCPQII